LPSRDQTVRQIAHVNQHEGMKFVSDRIYTNDSDRANHDFVTVAQACQGVLTKVNHLDGSQTAFGNVKYYNFFEEEVVDLRALFSLSNKLLMKPRCCILRCRIKDRNKRKGVVRKSNDDDATLLAGRFHWFAIDIDKYGESTGDLVTDASQVILALPSKFWDSECFAVASSSYGLERKPGINIRLFYWSEHEITNVDLNKAMRGTIADRSIYANPVQPIYTAAPIFDDGIDPIETRIVWIQRAYQTVTIPVSETKDRKGDPENLYTKQQADKFIDKALREIAKLGEGERHEGLIRWGYFIGKMIGQDHFEEEDMTDRVMTVLDLHWHGNRDKKKDLETLQYAIRRGIISMGRETVNV